MDKSQVGAQLRCARKSQGLSVAKASLLVALSPATIKRWEAGQGLPKRSCLEEYLDRIGLPDGSEWRQGPGFGPPPQDVDGPYGRPVLRLLRSKRRRMGITLQELSLASGTSVASLHRYECGTRIPSGDKTRQLSWLVGLGSGETERLLRRLSDGEVDTTSGSHLVDNFLDQGALPHYHVYAALDSISLARCDPAMVRESLTGLLFMGDHAGILENWPMLKQACDRDRMSRGDTATLASLLALVKLKSGEAERLWVRASSLPEGQDRIAVTLNIARLATLARNFELGERCVRFLRMWAEATRNSSVAFLGELNLRALEFEKRPSESPLSQTQRLRETCTGVAQEYNVDVALLAMADRLGSLELKSEVTERIRGFEATFGLGSPLARRILSKPTSKSMNI